MRYLQWHWGDVYQFTWEPDGTCTAQARFGSNDTLTANTPNELLTLVRRHYPRHKISDQCST